MQKYLENSNLVVFLLENYDKNIIDVMKLLKKNNCKTCNILLRTPYSYFVSDLKKTGSFSNDFFYVDFLSSHYKLPKKKINVFFLIIPTLIIYWILQNIL